VRSVWALPRSFLSPSFCPFPDALSVGWTEALAVGSPAIDNELRVAFDLADQLGQAYIQGTTADVRDARITSHSSLHSSILSSPHMSMSSFTPPLGHFAPRKVPYVACHQPPVTRTQQNKREET